MGLHTGDHAGNLAEWDLQYLVADDERHQAEENGDDGANADDRERGGVLQSFGEAGAGGRADACQEDGDTKLA